LAASVRHDRIDELYSSTVAGSASRKETKDMNNPNKLDHTTKGLFLVVVGGLLSYLSFHILVGWWADNVYSSIFAQETALSFYGYCASGLLLGAGLLFSTAAIMIGIGFLLMDMLVPMNKVMTVDQPEESTDSSG
jgi:hypothetical protein